MNGIIHPCCHPEDGDDPSDEDEMVKRIFKYIERIFNMVRPRKLLFMAIDGVAPRAKMNQQRARRFKAAREAEERLEAAQKLRAEYTSAGRKNLPEPTKKWDSNVITPGTPFMDMLANSLHYFIKDKLNTDPGWAGIEVIFSDANVPGEGEHKIMNHIRLQRVQPGWPCDVKHVLYGLDADLIMLGLATHEVYFTILREEVLFNQTKCSICGQEGVSTTPAVFEISCG
jgi:5'-3' exoribonuclease 2